MFWHNHFKTVDGIVRFKDVHQYAMHPMSNGYYMVIMVTRKGGFASTITNDPEKVKKAAGTKKLVDFYPLIKLDPAWHRRPVLQSLTRKFEEGIPFTQEEHERLNEEEERILEEDNAERNPFGEIS